eukprot:scaffold93358_cov53-Phaeocystis_antarctica.AAC.1
MALNAAIQRLQSVLPSCRIGAATGLAKVTGVIVTARGSRGQFHEKNRHVTPQTQLTEPGDYCLMILSSVRSVEHWG